MILCLQSLMSTSHVHYVLYKRNEKTGRRVKSFTKSESSVKIDGKYKENMFRTFYSTTTLSKDII